MRQGRRSRPLLYYLHGFNSSPYSFKAQYFKDNLAGVDPGYRIRLFNFNQGQKKFSSLTLSRQIEQVESALLKQGQKVYLVGSSLGGLTASWVASRNPGRVKKMVLLAPAFAFARQLRSHLLGAAEINNWRRQGYRMVEHTAYHNKALPLNYGFYEDLRHWPDSKLQIKTDTLIFYGKKDDVILPAFIEKFAASRSSMHLVALNDDHSLQKSIEKIFEKTLTFFSE